MQHKGFAGTRYSTLAPLGDSGLSGTDVGAKDRCMRVLHRQLDTFGKDDAFLGRFEVLGREDRRRGGQAVVQFLQCKRGDFKFAAKFFMDPKIFAVEAVLYAACNPSITSTVLPATARASHKALGAGGEGGMQRRLSAEVARFLPQVEAVLYDHDDLVDTLGRPLPPCIVMEKGESLHDWSDRAQPDLFMSVSVLSNISQRLADMHAAGFVHRDLKPANIMWLPRENRWTIIDFGCAARAGEIAPLNFTLAYAAPEVVAAYHRSAPTITVTEALDAWSLGVMAFELLTGTPPFRFTDGRCRVFAQLMGDLPLPWEGDLGVGVLRKLGAFKTPVLQLLHRDPVQRLTVQHFRASISDLFANGTTVEA